MVFSEKKLKSHKRDDIDDLFHPSVAVGTGVCAGLVPPQRGVTAVCVIREGVRHSGRKSSVGTSGDSCGLCKPRRCRIG